MSTFFADEVSRLPGESVIPTDTATLEAVNPAWTLAGGVWTATIPDEGVVTLDWWTTSQYAQSPLTPRMGYILTIEVNADQDATVRWLAHVTYQDGGTLPLADGAANHDADTPIMAGAWQVTARAWDAPAGVTSGSFSVEVSAPIGTLVQLRAPMAAPLDGPLVVRADRVVARSIETSPDGDIGVVIDNAAWQGFPGVVFNRTYPGMSHPPALAAYTADGRGFEGGALVLHGGRVPGGGESRIGATPTVTSAYTRSADAATWSLVETKTSRATLVHQAPTGSAVCAVDDAGAAIYTSPATGDGAILRAEGGSATYGRVTAGSVRTVPLEPLLVAPPAPAGWSTQFLTGGIVVRPSLAGKHCHTRVRLTRTGAALALTTSFTTIAAGWIPADLRTSLEDQVDARVTSPGDVVVRATYSSGDIAVRASSSLSVSTGGFFTVTLDWFVPTT